MTNPEYASTAGNDFPDEWDVIVLGSGAGGGTLARRLQDLGKKVLVLERGRYFPDSLQPGERQNQVSLPFQPTPGPSLEPITNLSKVESLYLSEKIGSDKRPLLFNGHNTRLLTGAQVGGGTRLYGAALFRPGPSDFAPAAHYPKALRPAFGDAGEGWPVSYSELEPYYDMAEELYGVRADYGTRWKGLYQRKNFPGSVDHENSIPAASALSPANADFSSRCQKAINFASMPLGIRSESCDSCPYQRRLCPGFPCPTGARASSINRALFAPGRSPVPLLSGVEVLEVERSGEKRRRVTGLLIQLRDAQAGRRLRLRCRILAVCAGAVGTPAFMQQHGLDQSGGRINSWIGKNYAFHLGVVFLVKIPSKRPRHRPGDFVKQLASTDFYLDADGQKLGYIQQLPHPGPGMLGEKLHLGNNFFTRWAAKVVAGNFQVFAAAIEDLPQEQNRVSFRQIGGQAGMEIHHRFHAHDLARAEKIKGLFQAALKGAGYKNVLTAVAGKERIHTAHQVGSCRFGFDAGKAALDRDCRFFHLDNVYCVDGCFLPNSLGVGPALTIMANALRVGDIISASCGGS